jgi:phage tail-like protein
MAIFREKPYGNYNFLVNIGSGDEDGIEAGFAEVILPEASVEIIEYRNGNEKTSESRIIPGRVKYENVVLKRGIIGSLAIYEWFNEVRDGSVNSSRNVTIKLLNENRTDVVITWKLSNAYPANYSFSNLEAQGKKVLIEKLELAYERMVVE